MGVLQLGCLERWSILLWDFDHTSLEIKGDLLMLANQGAFWRVCLRDISSTFLTIARSCLRFS